MRTREGILFIRYVEVRNASHHVKTWEVNNKERANLQR